MSHTQLNCEELSHKVGATACRPRIRCNLHCAASRARHITMTDMLAPLSPAFFPLNRKKLLGGARGAISGARPALWFSRIVLRGASPGHFHSIAASAPTHCSETSPWANESDAGFLLGCSQLTCPGAARRSRSLLLAPANFNHGVRFGALFSTSDSMSFSQTPPPQVFLGANIDAFDAERTPHYVEYVCAAVWACRPLAARFQA